MEVVARDELPSRIGGLLRDGQCMEEVEGVPEPACVEVPEEVKGSFEKVGKEEWWSCNRFEKGRRKR